MSIGIYLLKFENTSKVYVGQSIDIERRYTEHLNELKNNNSSKKLLNAFTNYGKPILHIYLICSIEDLNTYENKIIVEFDSVINGFNSLYEAGNPIQKGYTSPHAKESKEVYTNILMLLVKSNKTIKEIAKELNTTIYIVSAISSGKTHLWLKEEFPFEYELLELNKGNRTRLSSNKIISPEGMEHTVDKISEFAKTYGLDKGHLSSVLSGKRKSHKGWKCKN